MYHTLQAMNGHLCANMLLKTAHSFARFSTQNCNSSNMPITWLQIHTPVTWDSLPAVTVQTKF